jgi:PAS domain S-box-containing protein
MGSSRQDITEGKRAEELLRAQRDLALAIGKARSFEEGMHVCLETAIRISEMDCGGIYLRDETSGALDLVINRGLPAEFIASASHYEKDATNTQLVMAGRAIYSEHLQLGVPLDEAERREGLRAIAVIPILHEDRVIGCMNIASHSRAEVPAFARDALEAVAAQIGNAIIHLRTEEGLRYQATLLANTHDAITASDEHYRLTAWNAAAESLYGWKAEEVFGRFGLDILQTEFPGVNKSEMLRTIAETGHWRGEVTQARKDGTRIPVEVASIVLHDESGRITGYVSVNRDITERKRAEEVVRKSEEKYRSLTENINLGIYRNTVGPKGKFIEANPAIIRMFGYKSKEEFLAINVSNLYQNEEDRKKFNDKMLKEGFVKDEELWLRTKDGSLFFGSVSAVAVKDKQGHVKYYDGIIDNITERKWAEEALKKSEEHFRALTENASDMIIILDKKGTITYTSPSIERFSGYKPEELIGKKGFDFIKPVDLPRAIYDFGKAILARETVIPDTFRMRHKDGSERIFDGLGKNLLDNPVIAGFVMNVRDITERKRAEEERTRLLADLEAKNRELESFVYTISHDLKAPLVSLNGFSSVLQKKYESQLGEEGKHCLERIQANVAHMEALITSLLELSRIGQVVGPIEEIDVAALLRKIRDALAIRLNEAGAEFVVQEPLPTVRADRGRIHQVFANLIDNAVKFRSTERALRIEVGCRQESGFYRFHVTDNGIGIAPQFHEQIFAPFRKLHPEIEGAGIGLALVKKIVEHHGGRAWVESTSAKFIPSKAEGIGTGNKEAGATFYFTLPIERRVNVSI